MNEPGLDGRHRDKNGRIGKKHGNAQIGTLRKHYGQGFAPDFKETDKLADVLAKLDEPSLSKLVKDEAAGKLADHIAAARK
jgi:hypothetical protein